MWRGVAGTRDDRTRAALARLSLDTPSSLRERAMAALIAGAMRAAS
jgi:hypothetical protein